MKRVAEIIHITQEDRASFLEGALSPNEETKEVLWLCGVRKQQYFALNDLIFMTFEYEGKDFNSDMTKMAEYLKKNGHLVEKRRRDVPPEERETTNWWAPVKKLGSLLEEIPSSLAKPARHTPDYIAMLDGFTHKADIRHSDISFDEDDWSEGMHF